MKDFQRTIQLHCPTCGGTDFENAANEDPTTILECAICHRTMTRERLLEDNAEHIKFQEQEMVKEVEQQVAQELNQKLRDAFRGSKFIKVK